MLTDAYWTKISHNASCCNSKMHICAHFYSEMVHYGIWDWCTEIFEQQVYLMWGPIRAIILGSVFMLNLGCFPASIRQNHMPVAHWRNKCYRFVYTCYFTSNGVCWFIICVDTHRYHHNCQGNMQIGTKRIFSVDNSLYFSTTLKS